MDWQPIETAPKDGTHIMIHRGDAPAYERITMAYWYQEKFQKIPKSYWRSCIRRSSSMADRTYEATHWMPLPEPPSVGDD